MIDILQFTILQFLAQISFPDFQSHLFSCFLDIFTYIAHRDLKLIYQKLYMHNLGGGTYPSKMVPSLLQDGT